MSQIGRPRLRDTFLEAIRCGLEFTSLGIYRSRLLQSAPKGDGAPVFVLPGFGADDWMTRPLRQFLREIGYYVHGWRNGMNTGLNQKTADHLKERLEKIHNQHGRKVTLIGHSLGGIFARELAREFPDMVEQVITLGSPFGAAGHPKSTSQGVRTIFRLLNPDDNLIDDQRMHRRSLTPPPVPTSSLYTRTDGIVHWKTCINPSAPRAENIEIPASHCGIIMNVVSLLVVADRLAQDPENWEKFDRTRYPAPSWPRNEAHESFCPENPEEGCTSLKLF